jgi:hypothetical protein
MNVYAEKKKSSSECRDSKRQAARRLAGQRDDDPAANTKATGRLGGKVAEVR